MARFTLQPNSENGVTSDPLFLAYNIDGSSSYSNDGVNWNLVTGLTVEGVEGPEQLIGTFRVSVADGYIILLASTQTFAENQIFYSFDVDQNPIIADVSAMGPWVRYNWLDIDSNGSTTIAVGRGYDEADNAYPVWAYTTNGQDWTLGSVDSGYQDFALSAGFTSVTYGANGWFIVAGAGDGDNASLGGFFIENLTDDLGEATYVNFFGLESPPSSSRIVWTGEVWVARTQNATYAFSSESNPLTSTWSEVLIADVSLDGLFLDANGNPSSDFYEVAGGNGWFVSSSGMGQVVATRDSGQTWTTSIPKQYGGDSLIVAQSNPATLVDWNATVTGSDWDGLATNLNEVELFTIYDATPSSYNGTYFAQKDTETDVVSLYTDIDLTTPFDSSGLPVLESGKFTLGRGTYFDALAYGMGRFILGNDDEQLFLTGTSLTDWDVVADYENNFQYWDDISFNPTWGQSAKLTAGDKTFSVSSIGDAKFPGAEILSTKIYNNQDETIVLSTDKQVYVLNPGNYVLPNGKNGQVVYFVPNGTWSANNIYVSLNARYMSAESTIIQASNAGWIMGYNPNALYSIGSSAAVPALTGILGMAIFTDGYWNISGGTPD